MTDLLVSSLMADGGLEIALLTAIKIEVHDIEESSFDEKNEQDKPIEDDFLMTEQAQMESESKRCYDHLRPEQQQKAASIPLLLLVKQILKNAGLQTMAFLQNRHLPEKDANSNLNLLLRFQRLLFIQLFKEINATFTGKKRRIIQL